MKPLTKPQQRLLERARREGTLRLNGRATSMVEALRAHGLIDAEFELLASAIGEWRQMWTVRAKPYADLKAED